MFAILLLLASPSLGMTREDGCQNLGGATVATQHDVELEEGDACTFLQQPHRSVQLQPHRRHTTCEEVLPLLATRADELSVLCQAALPPATCSSALIAMGTPPWSSDLVTKVCEAWTDVMVVTSLSTSTGLMGKTMTHEAFDPALADEVSRQNTLSALLRRSGWHAKSQDNEALDFAVARKGEEEVEEPEISPRANTTSVPISTTAVATTATATPCPCPSPAPVATTAAPPSSTAPGGKTAAPAALLKTVKTCQHVLPLLAKHRNALLASCQTSFPTATCSDAFNALGPPPWPNDAIAKVCQVWSEGILNGRPAVTRPDGSSASKSNATGANASAKTATKTAAPSAAAPAAAPAAAFSQHIQVQNHWSHSNCQEVLPSLAETGEQLVSVCQQALPEATCKDMLNGLGAQPWSSDKIALVCQVWSEGVARKEADQARLGSLFSRSRHQGNEMRHEALDAALARKVFGTARPPASVSNATRPPANLSNATKAPPMSSPAPAKSALTATSSEHVQKSIRRAQMQSRINSQCQKQVPRYAMQQGMLWNVCQQALPALPCMNFFYALGSPPWSKDVLAKVCDVWSEGMANKVDDEKELVSFLSRSGWYGTARSQETLDVALSRKAGEVPLPQQ